MDDETVTLLGVVLPVLAVFAAITITVHAALTRDDPGTALGWIGLAWLSPLIGAALYALLGVNRIRRLARTRRDDEHQDAQRDCLVLPETLTEHVDVPEHLSSLARAMDRITSRPLVRGCHVELLIDGDETYPAMIRAIDEAQRYIGLMSYIFESHGPGEEIIAALVRAKMRGVQVRVLVDAVGDRYGTPRVSTVLRKRGIRTARFLPGFPPWRWPYWNLRNHRKVLVIDGVVGFAGGINIRPHHVLRSDPPYPTRDFHACFTGPVVAQLVSAFQEDWTFASGETLEWTCDPSTHGSMATRLVLDGPDGYYDRAAAAFLAAIATARERIIIATPYFLPAHSIATALQTAARRGVQVDVIIPSHSNLYLVGWAMEHALQVLPLEDVNVWCTPAPFDHSKLLVIDGAWCFVGSANWDPRSLRLNFELNVECYDHSLAQRLVELADAKIERATRHVPVHRGWRRVRNALVGLLRPYL